MFLIVDLNMQTLWVLRMRSIHFISKFPWCYAFCIQCKDREIKLNKICSQYGMIWEILKIKYRRNIKFHRAVSILYVCKTWVLYNKHKCYHQSTKVIFISYWSVQNYLHHSCFSHQNICLQTWPPVPCQSSHSPQQHSPSIVVVPVLFQTRYNKTAALLLGNGHPSYLLGAWQISIANSLLLSWKKVFWMSIIDILSYRLVQKTDII